MGCCADCAFAHPQKTSFMRMKAEIGKEEKKLCGFVGFAKDKIEPEDGLILSKMMERIAHRGPDDAGMHLDTCIALGFQRLNIVDLSDAGHQPMYNEDGSCVLCFNGEIYNYKELRNRLQKLGYRFHSQTDSEVLLCGYEEYGIEILRQLRGMFAFAIWDARLERLVLARDFFGIKPLYYTQHTGDNALLFGSEIKSFLNYPIFQKELNRDALLPYLTFQYSALEETFFKGVFKLKPAHFLIYERGKVEVRPYWDFRFRTIDRTLKEHIKEIQRAMQDSIQCHQQGDVPVGAFLSGGVDSSYVAALSQVKKTFSVGFAQDQFDETELAADLSSHLGAVHYKKLLSPEACFDALPDIQYYMDEPAANPSAVPLYFLAQLASKKVKVALSGEGADELFGGYQGYQISDWMRRYRRLPFPLWRGIYHVSKWMPQVHVFDFLTRGGRRVEEQFIGQAKIFEEADAKRLLKPDYQNGPQIKDVTEHIYQGAWGQDDLTKMQYLDLKLWLPNDILLKADKMSMAHSLELRVPLLDRELLRAATGLPSSYRINKCAFRLAAGELLPLSWANRSKVGFPVPLRHWLREEPYYQSVKASFESDLAREFFHVEELISLLDNHYYVRAENGRKIWTVYVFLTWYRRFFEEAQGKNDRLHIASHKPATIGAR